MHKAFLFHTKLQRLSYRKAEKCLHSCWTISWTSHFSWNTIFTWKNDTLWLLETFSQKSIKRVYHFKKTEYLLLMRKSELSSEKSEFLKTSGTCSQDLLRAVTSQKEKRRIFENLYPLPLTWQLPKVSTFRRIWVNQYFPNNQCTMLLSNTKVKNPFKINRF